MSNLQLLTMMCHEIEPILEQTILVGGCATELLLTDKAAPEVRYTIDVDMLIEVVSLTEYYQACEQLKSLGFHENHEVICRWEKNGLILDFMPTDEKILGFGNPWYKDAIKHKSLTVLDGMTVYHISAPYFIATNTKHLQPEEIMTIGPVMILKILSVSLIINNQDTHNLNSNLIQTQIKNKQK